MKHHQIKIVGPQVDQHKISASLLSEILSIFVAGSKATLRYRAEGRSNAPGIAPNWLTAADFEVTGLSPGSTIIEVEAPSLIEAAPDKFQQQNLFWDIDPTDSGLELFENALSEALEGKADSDLFDKALLNICTRLQRAFSTGIDELQLSNGGQRKLSITANGIERINRMRVETPLPRRVRIAGKLDAIRATGLFYELVLESGERLRGAMAGLNPEELKQYFYQDVVISGIAEFRPSGRVLRLDAEAIEKSTGTQKLWAKVPKPLAVAKVSEWRQPQDKKSGLAAIIGQWPGDESDEQVEQLLKEIS